MIDLRMGAAGDSIRCEVQCTSTTLDSKQASKLEKALEQIVQKTLLAHPDI